MLDLFFKKYAWTAHGVLLFAAAWLSAKTVNTMVSAGIRPKPSIDLSAIPSGPSTRPPEPARVDGDKLYALIGQKPPEAPPPDLGPSGGAVDNTPKTCSDFNAPPAKSSLRMQLIGGVVADRPEWSFASITDLTSRETKIYGIGDEVGTAPLISVERIKDEKGEPGESKIVAIICNNGAKEYIDFEAGDGAVATNLGTFTPPPPMHQATNAPDDDAGPAGGKPMEGIKKISDNRYEIKRSVIDNTLSNLNTVATQARIVPSFKGGVANGFKLFSIQPGSLYSSIGIENGDVIQRINGYEINSPDKALEVYQKLKESNHISIEVDRNGQVVRKEYNVGQ